MRCLDETLAATDEASPHPLAIAEEERKQRWEEADIKRVGDTIPPVPLFIKGRGEAWLPPLGQSGLLR